MLQPYRSSLVNLKHIDFKNTFYNLSPEGAMEPSADLEQSVARIGILHPPILKEQDTAMYTIVTGYKRLIAADRAHGLLSTVCLILPKETNDSVALSLNLEDTLLRGNVTPVEKAIFLSKILRAMDEQEVIDRFLPVLGLEANRHLIRKNVELLNLEDHILLAVHLGLVHEGAARELLRLSFTDRMSLFEIIDLLHLSVGNQKKIIAACRELASRSSSSIMAVLGAPQIKEIINHPEANPPQKAGNLMHYLAAQCQPRLHEAEGEFRKFAGALNLPKGVKLEHDLSFERDTLTLAVPFKNREALQKIWPELALLLQKNK